MKKSSKAMMTIGAGLLAGGLAGYYLNSDRGRDVRSNAQEGIMNGYNQASERVSSWTDGARSYINNLTSKARSKASGVASTTRQKASHVQHAANNVSS